MMEHKFMKELRNAAITTVALKLMQKVLEEHLKLLSEGEEGTDLGAFLSNEMSDLIDEDNQTFLDMNDLNTLPNVLFFVFLHNELMDTLKDWQKLIIKSGCLDFDNSLEETFALGTIKEKT